MIQELETTLSGGTTPPISEPHTQASDQIAPQTLELIEVPTVHDRPLFSTPLEEYSVSEGLLLLIFVLLLVKSFVGLVREVL